MQFITEMAHPLLTQFGCWVELRIKDQIAIFLSLPSCHFWVLHYVWLNPPVEVNFDRRILEQLKPDPVEASLNWIGWFEDRRVLRLLLDG